MGSDLFEISVNLIKMIIIFVMMVQLVPLLVWVERRGSAFIQNRLGPNRIGPLGLTQLLADAVKFIFKEEFIPEKTKKFIFYAAPVVSLIPAALAFGAIPLSMPINIEAFTMFGESYGPYRFAFQSFELGIGIVFVLGISSLGPYAMLMAGWASNNKYSLLGALRACAQSISYELALGLSIVGVLLLYGTFDFSEMIAAQQGPLNFMWFGKEVTLGFLPNWGIFYQPLGAIIFLTAVFAETNRTPFDLPEAEAELVAGYHTEYSGLKMNMFYIGEYGHMMAASALMAVFYFGGYDIPFVTAEDVNAGVTWFGQAIDPLLTTVASWAPFVGDSLAEALGFSANKAAIGTAFVFHIAMFAKILFFLWVFVWVRWTIPRFRYDQLMDLGWKTMLPWALFNTIITAIVIFIMRTNWS